MTGSISRSLYQRLLLLYPEPFRHEFGDEILGIFEECKRAQGLWRVLADVLLSAVKQQVHYCSIFVPKSAPLYLEIKLSPNLARMLAVAAFGVSLIAGALVGPKRGVPESWRLVRPEALFWFPIIPEGRYCSGTPEQTNEPERIFTTGVLVRGNARSPQYWTVVRGKTRFWISTVPWGQYCLDTPERTRKPESVLVHVGVRTL